MLHLQVEDMRTSEHSSGILLYRYVSGKRKYLCLKNGEGWLDIPKGHVEEGESEVEAAIRETLEETKIQAIPDIYYKDYNEYVFKRGGKPIRKGLSIFVANAKTSKVKVSNEHVGYKWLDVESAMKELKFKDQRISLTKADQYVDRREAMDRLNIEYSKLPKRSNRWDLSYNFVPGDGPVNARIMVIGQAPGRNEDEQKKPFVGASGKLLNKLFGIAGLKREDLYISSAVQFFPPKNRAPTREEITMCLPFIMKQIEIIKPKIIVLLGSISSKAIANVDKISVNHGKVIRSNYIFFPTLHPAAAVRIKKNVSVIENDFKNLRILVKKLDHGAV